MSRKGTLAIVAASAAISCLLVGVVGTSALAAQKKITFWHYWGGTRIPLMNKVIADFQKLNPGVKVEHSFIDPGTRAPKILSAVAAGSPPGLIMLTRGDVPSFVLRKVLLPLDSRMKRDRVSGDIFLKSEYETCRYEGKTWILPCASSGGLQLMFYNRQVFREAGLDPSRGPKTWQELELYSKKISLPGAGGTLKRIGYTPYVAKEHFVPYLYSNRGQWLSADGRKAPFDSPAAVETLRWMAEYSRRVYGEAKFSVADAWNKGAQAMMVDGTWQLYYMVAAKAAIDYGIDLIPHNEGAESHGTTAGGWGYCIPGNTKHPEEAWKLLKYLTVDPAGAGWFIKEQMRPTPIKAWNSDAFFRDNVHNWDRVLEAMDADIALPATPAGPDLDRILDAMIADTVSRKKSPDAAIRWAAKESQKILDDAWNRVGKRK